MFDEYLEPPRAKRQVPPAQAEPDPVNSAGTPLSNTIDQDAPTPKDSAQNSITEWCCRKTELYSSRSCSDNADIFQSSDISMGR
nr:hypothetical protein [Tanacetum cinerariifolium]